MTGRVALIWNVARSPALRRLEAAYAGFSLAEHATWLTILVYAYARGGVAETGRVATALLVAAVLAAPFAAYAGDRFRPGRALLVGSLVQALTAAAVAVAMWRDQPLVAYTVALVLTAALAFTRPVVTALLPTITTRPGDLVAANVVIGSIADVGLFLGPLAAAGLIALGDAELVMAVFAGVLVVAAACTVDIDRYVESIERSGPIGLRQLRRELVAGVRTTASNRPVRGLVILLFVGALSAGVVDVLVVSFAELRLDGGSSQAGLLAAGVGLGAVIGSLSSGSLVSGSRSRWFLTVGTLAVGLPFVVLAVAGELAIAILLVAMIGAGQSMLIVAGSVAIQRRTPGDTLARVFGVAESLQLLAMAVGAATGAFLIDRLELGRALVAVGAAVLVLLMLSVVWLVRVGADAAPPPASTMQRLAVDPIFRFADLPTLERLANGARTIECETPTTLITEGEPGDRYFLLVDGQVEVRRGGHVVEILGPGTSFGEIALLRDVPRTATVRCLTPATLLWIGRTEFLEIVTGHPRRLAEASDVADARQAPER